MANTTSKATSKAKTLTKATRPVGRPPKNKSMSQRLEDLKLGKFTDCDTLCLPEKEAKRGWQVLGGILLILLAIFGAGYLLLAPPLNYFWSDSVMSFGASLANEKFYWLVAALAMIVVVVTCLVSGVMLLGKKRVPVGAWYILIGAMVTVLICLSFHTFRRYEQRECYKNYPHIIDADYACPSVIGELSWIVAKDLLIFAAGVGAIYLVHHNLCHHRKPTKK